MAWEILWINQPHLAYALGGAFCCLYFLLSKLIKDKLYIGEVTIAVIVGIIIGPHCLDWFHPNNWDGFETVTLEFSRVLVVFQIFIVGFELPRKYLKHHWLSVAVVLLFGMVFGWLVCSVMIWKLVPTLTWVQGLVIAACITASDPVLAAAIVGKNKFARKISSNVRHLLACESACNDGMVYPFAYLALYIIRYTHNAGKVSFNFLVVVVLYQCVFGSVLGAFLGYLARKLLRFADKKNWIEEAPLHVFCLVMAFVCTGVGTVLGVDDFLVSFFAGSAFAWDGWFMKRSHHSHVVDVFDTLLNLLYFTYFGAIVPWEQFNNTEVGLYAWRLVVLGIVIMIVRRIPILIAIKPITPDLQTWKHALFYGHFGPIGVAGIFISLIVKAELTHDDPNPTLETLSVTSENYYTTQVIFPIVTFLVVTSIIVHGLSVPVYIFVKTVVSKIRGAGSFERHATAATNSSGIATVGADEDYEDVISNQSSKRLKQAKQLDLPELKNTV